jgi:hypothetical protein
MNMLRQSPLCSVPHVRYPEFSCDPCRGPPQIRSALNPATEPSAEASYEAA